MLTSSNDDLARLEKEAAGRTWKGCHILATKLGTLLRSCKPGVWKVVGVLGSVVYHLFG